LFGIGHWNYEWRIGLAWRIEGKDDLGDKGGMGMRCRIHEDIRYGGFRRKRIGKAF